MNAENLSSHHLNFRFLKDDGRIKFISSFSLYFLYSAHVASFQTISFYYKQCMGFDVTNCWDFKRILRRMTSMVILYWLLKVCLVSLILELTDALSVGNTSLHCQKTKKRIHSRPMTNAQSQKQKKNVDIVASGLWPWALHIYRFKFHGRLENHCYHNWK